MNSQDFTKAMRERSDEEPYEIVNFGEEDGFVPDAIAAADKELENHNLSPADLSTIVESVKRKRGQQMELASLPLSWPSRIAFFILGPGFIPILIAYSLESRGYNRKSSEAWKWIFRGFKFWFGLGVIFFLIGLIMTRLE